MTSATHRIVLIGHDPSPNLARLCAELVRGARQLDVSSVSIEHLRPLEADADDVLDASAVILLTPENLGYMSGALKDFFDRCFRDLEGRTDALPYATLIRAGKDGTGTRRAIESICGGLNWKPIQAPVICRGDWDDEFLEGACNLGMTMAAGLDAGIF